MSLKLYMHPLSSYCHKVLIALYENGTAFERQIVDLGDPAQREAFRGLWPLAKFPVLRDEARDLTIPESSIIIEYLAQQYPGDTALLPTDAEQARETRLRDRFFDLHVHDHLQKIVGDRLRPAESRDALGVALAHEKLDLAYDLLDALMATRSWAAGETFGMADCAAAPALFYAGKLHPFGGDRPHLSAYFDRLRQRASYARVLSEAQPYMHMFPG